MDVIALAGLPGSGKSLAAEIAANYGYESLSGGEIVRGAARRRNLPVSDRSLGRLTEKLRQEYGEDVLAKAVLEDIQDSDCDRFIVDSPRNIEEVNLLRDKLGDNLRLVVIHSDFPTRLQRILSRDRADDISSEEALRERDNREKEWGLEEVMSKADIEIENEGTLNEFEDQVTSILETR